MQQTPTELGAPISSKDQQYVESLVTKIFSALPSDKGVNPADMLDTYMLALLGQPINAFRSVVYKLLTGTLDRSIRFVPRPPELANYVRDEASRLRRLSAPPALPAPAKPSAIMAAQKRWDGGRILVENCSIDQARAMARRNEIPVGSIYVAALGKVFAP